MLIDNNAQELRRGSWSPRRLPHPATDLQFPQRPSLHGRDDLPLGWKTTDASTPQPGGSRRGGPTSESAPSGGPSGLDREHGGGGGGSTEGGASPQQLGATSWQGRVTHSHRAEARPFHCTIIRLPLRSFFVGQLGLGRRHYHIALRGSRHLTA